MIDYNDGNWHRFDGVDCPVHPKSMVQTYFIHRGEEPDTQPNGVQTLALQQRWGNVIAFRVVKEHREPFDGWIVQPMFKTEEDAKQAFPFSKPVHVREVTE